MPFAVSFSEKTWGVLYGIFKRLASVPDSTLRLSSDMHGLDLMIMVTLFWFNDSNDLIFLDDETRHSFSDDETYHI